MKRFSASRLQTAKNCQMQFKFKYVDKIPEEGVGAAAVYGQCVHLALEKFNAQETDAKGAVKLFAVAWNDPGKYGMRAPTIWAPRMSHAAYMKRGKESIKAYVESITWRKREVVAVEHKFLVPIGDYELTGYVDHMEITKDKKGRRVLLIEDHKTSTRAPSKTYLQGNIQFCADEETEILTRRGWKSYTELNEGEDVLTYNQALDVSQWQPATSVNVFNTDDQSLVSMEGKAHSSLTTKNHRWPVERMKTSRTGPVQWLPEFSTSEQLNTAHRIPCAAPTVNLPEEKGWSDDFVALVAWYWTEGQKIPGENSGVVIGQSSSVNSHHVESIRRALTSEYGAACTHDMRRDKHKNLPLWKETVSDDCNRFYLNGSASRRLRSIVQGDEKVVDLFFVQSLTLDQLNLFIKVSLDADGHTGEGGVRVICQKSRPRLESFQMACSLAGIRTSLRARTVKGSGPYEGAEFFELSLKDKARYFTPQHLTVSEVRHTGQVWCPTTENKTWLARRNGHVYFTGNTIYDYASRQPEFWLGNGPDFPPMEQGQWHMEMTKDLPRLNMWHGVTIGKQISAGERDEKDFERLHFALKQIDRAIENDVFMLDISGETCGFCPYTVECGLPIHDDTGSDW